MTRPAAETLGQCRNCKRTFDPYVRTPEGYVVHLDGSVRTPGSPAKGVMLVGDQVASCPSCGYSGDGREWVKWWAFKDIKAKYTMTRCEEYCQTATGSDCKCSCGGWAHGSRA